MKKGLIIFLLAAVILLSLAACGVKYDVDAKVEVTWDVLIAANKLDAVFEKTDSFSVVSETADGVTHFFNAGLKDGKLIYSYGVEGNTEDYYDGVIYIAPDETEYTSIDILAPSADEMDLIDGEYSIDFSDYSVVGEIKNKDGQLVVKVYSFNEDYGVETNGSLYFNAQTLLLEKIDLVEQLGAIKLNHEIDIKYNIGDFRLYSYEKISNADDSVTLTVNYPDGSTRDITVNRNVELSAYYPDHLEEWSVCSSDTCNESIDDLGWITENKANVYICEGSKPLAPPNISRIIEKSSFESMFKENYETYFQSYIIKDNEENVILMKDLAWYIDEETGMSLNFEIKDADYNVIQSGRARNNAWYSWSAENGYAVDFYDDFTYAEGLIEDERFFINLEHLNGPVEFNEDYGCYSLSHTETADNGSLCEYLYLIHSYYDCIEYVEMSSRDSLHNLIETTVCYLGGNGPIPGDLDIFAAISAPEDVKTIELTVVTSSGEETYSLRSDAKISIKGEALYSDEACTIAVNDLTWVNGSSATVYAK